MKNTNRFRGIGSTLVVSVVSLSLAACGEREEAPSMDMPMEEMEMPMGMEMDPAMMERHADEAEEMAGEVRAHLVDFRGLSPDAQHERIVEHVGVVAGMLRLMDRQMAEMSMGMPMDDEAMGAMIGMSGDEHRRMMEGMAALRAELEELQVASVEEMRARMGGHLERLEAMAGMLEEMARAMRDM